MAKRMSRVAVVFVVVVVAAAAAAAVVVERGKATEYIVGDKLGWRKPHHGASKVYASWSSNHTFVVGDTLVFDFQEGADDVALVNKKDFDACNDTDPIFYTTIGPAVLEIQYTGNHYFISTVAGHCPAGQKLAVNVTAAKSPSPGQGSIPGTSADGPDPSDLPGATRTGGIGAPSPVPSPSFQLDATFPLSY